MNKQIEIKLKDLENRIKDIELIIKPKKAKIRGDPIVELSE